MSDTLSSRMVVNVLGIPGILLMIYLGRFYFAFFVTVVCLLALREFYGLAQKRGTSPQYWVGALSCIIISIFYYLGPASSIPLLNPREFFLIFILLIVLSELFRNKDNATANVVTTIGGIVYIPFLLGALIGLRQIDPLDYNLSMRITMSLFFGIWVCDTSAYAFGKTWGKKKILERVSPKKTVLGTTAGLILAVAFYLLIMSLGFFNSSQSVVSLGLRDAIVFGIIVGVFGQVGDFVESLFKRDIGVKDSSHFLKGHGGVLDRFDSLIVASPITYLYLKTFVY